MSIETPPDRMPRRTVAPWRQTASFAVSVALHAGLAALLFLFVASSDPDAGMRAPVPISIVTRGVTAAGLPAVQPGIPAAGADATGSFPLLTRRPAKPASARDRDRVPDRDIKQSISAGAVPVDEAAPSGQSSCVADGEGGLTGAEDATASGFDGPYNPLGTDGGASPAGNTSNDAGPASSDSADAGSSVRLEDERAYALAVRKALERQGAYPSTARRLGLEGLVEMLVRIDGSGLVHDRRVVTSSGFPQLDEAALASADRLGSLPPPPGSRPMDVRIPIRFSVRRN